MLDGILVGLQTALQPVNILMVILGCVAGTVIGMLPGLGPVTAIALLIPITYSLDPTSGLILMAGVYYGAVFGGSTSAILINAPGVSGAVATSFDGHPMAQKGKAGRALAIAAYSSFAGGTIGALLLLLFAPTLAGFSLSFQSSDYFALMIFGCTAISAFSGKGNVLKALMMTFLGLMLATVGESPSGAQRFTYGITSLYDGISFLLLSMATFALAEAIMIILQGRSTSMTAQSSGSLKLSFSQVKDMIPPVSRQSILGFLVGVLPGAGATISAFLSYGIERNLAPVKKRDEFGKGSIRGLAAPEASNNAASTGSFVPLLTLGIPGSATTAIMLGALLTYGIQPGPRLYVDHPTVFWSVIISMYFGNIVLLILNLPLIPYISKVLLIPRPLLIPVILFFSLMGVYLVSFNTFDLSFMVIVGVLGVVFRILGFPLAPLLLGFVLGDIMEDNLSRALLIWDGSFAFLWSRPLTLSILLAAIAMFLYPLISSRIQLFKNNNKTVEVTTSE